MTKTEWKLAERANEIKDLRWMLQKATEELKHLKLDHWEEVKELRQELSYWRNDHQLARDKWEEFLICNVDRAGKM